MIKTRVARRPGSQKSHDQLLRSIIGLLDILGIPAFRPESKPVAIKRNGKTIYVSRVEAGIPDIVAIMPPNGRFCAIEVKTGGSALRPAQQEWRDTIMAAGGEYIVARSMSDVDELIRRNVGTPYKS